jgi:inactive STAND
MSSVQHLQHKRKELQQQYDLLSQKIKGLQTDYIIQAGTSVRFQLEHEIKHFETQRDRLVKQIDSLESERIHIELFRLNYIKQVRLFREFIEQNRIGAFLVHGSPEHGQIFLLKRLLNAIPDGSVTPPFQFHLSRRAFRKDIKTLWRELGRQMQVEDYSLSEIARNVICQLKNQHVILVFHDMDCIEEDYLQELIREFWLPLVNSTQEAIYSRNEFFLLMFLVDQDGCVNTWNIAFADEFETLWQPCTPIMLPIIDSLSDQVLVNWMENAIDALPTKVTKKIDYTVKVILEKSEGIPERVFAEIFGLCGYSWEQGEDRWLKL